MNQQNIQGLARWLSGRNDPTFTQAVAEALTRCYQDDIGEDIRKKIAEVKDEA